MLILAISYTVQGQIKARNVDRCSGYLHLLCQIFARVLCHFIFWYHAGIMQVSCRYHAGIYRHHADLQVSCSGQVYMMRLTVSYFFDSSHLYFQELSSYCWKSIFSVLFKDVEYLNTLGCSLWRKVMFAWSMYLYVRYIHFYVIRKMAFSKNVSDMAKPFSKLCGIVLWKCGIVGLLWKGLTLSIEQMVVPWSMVHLCKLYIKMTFMVHAAFTCHFCWCSQELNHIITHELVQIDNHSFSL